MKLSLLSLTLLVLVVVSEGAVSVGVNWGNIASHPLEASTVVQMLKDNGIKKVKIFDADHQTLKALAGSGIETMIAIPNNQLKRMTELSEAQKWVKKNVTKFLHNGGVDIRYVAVGNEPYLASYSDDYKYNALPALKNIQQALEDAGHADKVKASIPINADVYESSNVPSNGDFRGDVKDIMADVVSFFKEKNLPFIVNIYPFISLSQSPDFPESYAFFGGGGGNKSIQDKGKNYDNVFDANFDTLIWSLKKHGAGDLEVIVGEIGWPTDGHIKANTTYAKRFYDGLLKKLASNKGTPMRSGHIEVYLFGLLDEDMKSIAPGNFERHWGIFRFDGQPKFPMDLNGQGNGKMLIGAKGVKYLEKKWCAYNLEAAKDPSKTGGALGYACANADCTQLEYGSSCNKLDFNGNVSFAFNQYFQLNDQSVEACQFEGLGVITSANISQNGCLFPIQIEAGAIKLAVESSMAVLFLVLLLLF